MALQKAIVTEMSDLFHADCGLRLSSPGRGWHKPMSLAVSGGTSPTMESWLVGILADQGQKPPPYPEVMVEELTARGRGVGVVCVGRADGPAFSDIESALFRGVSVAAALAVSNATLYQVQAEYAAVMQASGDAILAVDSAGAIRSCNKAAAALFGADTDTLIGRSILEFAADSDRERLRERLDSNLRSREVPLEMVCVSKDGRHVEVAVTLSPIGDSVELHVAAVVHDLTEIKRAQSEIRHLASHDPLTGLANRRELNSRLVSIAAEHENSGEVAALLYIDLDHFKKVNDSMGHAAGDQLLSIVAQRLRSCVKEGDTVARLGGDEFTVILRHVADAAAASAVAERIIQSMHMPVRLGGRDHLVRASIGVTLFPDDGVQLDDLLRNADLAMYRAKDMGRGTAVFYSPQMASRGGRVADSGLYRALKRREFSLYFQPQYSVRDGSLRGVEALLRWQRPRDGVVTSAEFIPAAEESGLIVDLGGWVLDSACAQLAQWRELGVSLPTLAVNLSVQQLRDPGMVPEVRRVLDRYRIPPAQLVFELNEAALTDTDSQTCIEELSALGVALTLDDFGTGSTALANLRRYPVTSVKIDRSFVEELGDNASAAALASTIIVMAHSLEKQVVAEGVETIEQLDFLRERGCDVAQGYFLARPLPAAAMTELLLGRSPDIAQEQSAIA